MKDYTGAQDNIFSNCLRLLNTEEGIIPVRFTDNQFDIYAKNPFFIMRTHCPSGVCIDIMTNSKTIKFEYVVKDQTRNYIYFDIYLNNVFMDSIGCDPIKAGTNEFYYEIPQNYQENNRLTVYLPHNVYLYIKNIEFSEGAVVEKAPLYKRSILCLGDSITHGMDAKHPASTYPVQISRFLGMNLLNQGVGGYYYNAESLDKEMPYRPDVITVAYGTNDWKGCESLEQLENNCSEYISRLNEYFPQAQIFVITPFWRSNLNDIKNPGTLYDVCNAIEKICKNYPKIKVIKGLELSPNLHEYHADGLHPTDEGFLHIAINLAKLLTHQKYEVCTL